MGLQIFAPNAEDEVVHDDRPVAWGLRMLLAGASMYAEYASGEPAQLTGRVDAAIALILHSQRRPSASSGQQNSQWQRDTADAWRGDFR
jgi:hypothetical protein